MSRYTGMLLGRKVQRFTALFIIFTLGLLSIIATGGGDGDDEPGTLQFSAAAYSGSEDAGAITVTVTRVGGSDGAASVEVSDAGGGSATPATDYTPITTTTLTWADGDSAGKTITVSAIADAMVEPDETVMLALSNATGATLGTPTSATVTILNDDGPGTLQFSPASYTAAEDGSGTATITVTRTGGTTGAVGVSYATSNGTATAGSDYTATSGTLSWGDGVSGAQTFTVAIIDDTDVEAAETVNLTLSSPTGGATLGTPSTAILTITSEDAFGALQFSTTSYSVDETDGSVSNVIALRRVNGSSGAVSVDVSDVGTGTATGSGTDYTFTSPTTVNWGDGDSADKNVTLVLVDDGDVEGSETVNLSLGNVTGGASIGTPGTATVNIADDDAPASAGELQFDAASYSVDEGVGSATITVNRINGTAGAVGVDFATSDGTATAGSDYTGNGGTLSWADGEGGAKTFTVAISDDVIVEMNETIALTLSSPTGGATLVAPSTAILTINDDDTNLTMTLGDGTYWVAFQDGPAGTWTEWSPTTANIYDFPVTDGLGRYGVAFHRLESDGVNTVEKIYVIQATLAELSSLDTFHNTQYTVSGTLSNYTGSNDSAAALMYVRGDGDDLVPDPYAYSILAIPSGLRDLLVVEWNAISSDFVSNFVLRRDINITGDLAGQDVDFTNDVDVEALVYTPHNFAGGIVGQLLEAYYSTSHGTAINLVSETYDGATAEIYPYVTNASVTQTDDAYSFQVSTGTGTKHRIRNFPAATDPGDQSIGLSSLATLAGTAVSTSQTTGLNYTPDPTSFTNAPVFRGYQIDLDQTVVGISGGAHWKLMVSTGWLGAATSYTHPTLVTISGFDSAWDMDSGTLTNTTVSALTSNNGTGLSAITRKTIGPSSNNLEPISWVVPKKLSHIDTLKLDIAKQFSAFTW